MRKIIIGIMILLTMILVAGCVYAEEPQLKAEAEISVNTTEGKAGDKVTFTFVIRDIENAQVLSGKIVGLQAKVNFDTNFFEYDSSNKLSWGEASKAIIVYDLNGIGEGETAGSLTLKIKENATGSGVVTFTEILASDGRTDDADTLGSSKTEDQSFTITLKTVEEEPTTPPEDGEEGDKENVIPEQKPDEDKKEDNTTTGGTKLPQTGIGNGSWIAVVFIGIISIVFFVSYRKYKDI